MSNKKIVFLVGAIAAWVVLLILMICNMAFLRNLEEQVERISIVSNQTVTDISGEETSGEETFGEDAPSILSTGDLRFAGKKINVEKNTIMAKASVIPLKFKKGTRAYVKVAGKRHELKQKDNEFTGRFPVSIFESVDCDVVLEDENNVRTEALYGLDPYIPMNFIWSRLRYQPSFRKDEVTLSETISVEGDVDFSSADVVGVVDQKQVYRKSFPVVYLEDYADEGVDYNGFELEDSIDLPQGKALELYVITKAKQGYTYRFRLGTVQQNSDSEEGQTLELLDPSGKSIKKKTADKIREDGF